MKNIKKGNFDNYSYPLGADAAHNCPWNQPADPEPIPWEALCHEDCGNCGAEAVWCNGQGICEECYPDNPEYEEQDDVIFDKGYED